MANTYLIVTYSEKDAAKALGAKWDSVQRSWYVPEGRELAPFSQWLPKDGVATKATIQNNAVENRDHSELAAPATRGISLSALLGGVSTIVSRAYQTGVWVMVEVEELYTVSGHIYLGVSERDHNGGVLAKSQAVIWQRTAQTILPKFQSDTGIQFAPGMKILVRGRPIYHQRYGFTITIDNIDSEYTLGELAAKKRKIRERLKTEGVFTANKQLPYPWDFNVVLVIAPAGGAGLGDFQAEAERLEQFGICHFDYIYSRFQGEGAAREICDKLQKAMSIYISQNNTLPDAVVIIRGGGPVNDIAWLNDYDLARYICDLPVPALTGIGHERDSTVLDEVANCKYDTPSKVIAGIEQTIKQRTSDAKIIFEQLINTGIRYIQESKLNTTLLDTEVRRNAMQQLTQGRKTTLALINEMKLNALNEIRIASDLSAGALQFIKTEAKVHVQQAKQSVPTLWNQIVNDANHSLKAASASTFMMATTVLDNARIEAAIARNVTKDSMEIIGTSAKQIVQSAKNDSKALMREIVGQGPEKTLKRGFAIIRNQEGKPITRAAQTVTGSTIEIQFIDANVSANIDQ
ncbi:exodeoxyribonuclease VII large subunit [Candidatus Symbiobacter mobilis]|uniref:Exodeoxyribonuclease VII large subunit n=1 Tax=Candidatus Symbiobacter mobilis CR TaxID=946483 RepID=U5N9L6_9BURK|nr:exodeoxyribonuclease VII large subunit [Candidatus Symbiobacter mobilis]AGX86933.1 exodeoxyribonuclease VII large subunit [Candidatus Symbiobacter mobilis CR]